MNSLTVVSFTIPAFVAVGLITMLIKERYNFIPKRVRGENLESSNNHEKQNLSTNSFVGKRKYPDDYLDLSGGIMGI